MIFVQAVDGQFYVDPKIGGKSWYLDFVDEGAIIRVKKYGSTNDKSASTRARRLLKMAAVKAIVQDSIGDDTVLFPPKFDSLENAVNFRVRIKEPIPVPGIFSEVVNAPALEHPMLAWKMTFAKQEVKDVFDDRRRPNLMIVKFLTGESIYRRSEIDRIRGILMDHLPGFKRYKNNPDAWFEKQPDEITIEL